MEIANSKVGTGVRYKRVGAGDRYAMVSICLTIRLSYLPECAIGTSRVPTQREGIRNHMNCETTDLSAWGQRQQCKLAGDTWTVQRVNMNISRSI